MVIYSIISIFNNLIERSISPFMKNYKSVGLKVISIEILDSYARRDIHVASNYGDS